MNYAEEWGGKIKWVPVDSDKGYDLDKIEKNIDSNTRMVFIANPNNPTGTLLDKNALSVFCEKISEKTLVFCDEAYYDYISDPAYPSMDYLIRENKHSNKYFMTAAVTFVSSVVYYFMVMNIML